MVPLPLANILHHKVRSALSALGVAIGVCMLITLSGLSRGSLEEVADRWGLIDADLIVAPARLGDSIVTVDGGLLSERDVAEVAALTTDGTAVAGRAFPIFIRRLKIAGQLHAVVGVDPENLSALLGGRDLLAGGRVFDPEGRFAKWLGRRLSASTDEVVDVSPRELAEHGGLEMIVDTRLARAAGLKVGATLHAVGHEFTIVGIAPEGAMVRAFIPLSTAQFLFNNRLGRSTLLMVKLGEGVSEQAAIKAIRATRRLSAIPVGQYRSLLLAQFGIMYVYVDVVNVITLIVAMLFILVTLYTTLIQRTREIAILRSMGATRGYVLRQVICESLIRTACGATAGIVLALLAGAAIEAFRPFLTVTVTWRWVLVGAAAAIGGGIVAGLYPAFHATRIDVTEALNLE